MVPPPGQQQQQPTEGRLELVALVRRRLTNQAFDFSMTAEAQESGSPTVQPNQLIRVQVRVPASQVEETFMHVCSSISE